MAQYVTEQRARYLSDISDSDFFEKVVNELNGFDWIVSVFTVALQSKPSKTAKVGCPNNWARDFRRLYDSNSVWAKLQKADNNVERLILEEALLDHWIMIERKNDGVCDLASLSRWH